MQIKEIAQSKEFSEYLLDNLCTGIFILNKDAEIIAMNQAFEQIFGKEEKDVLRQRCGNAIGCIFAIEEDTLCGETTQCCRCPLREMIGICFSEKEKVHQRYLTRVLNLNQKKVKKYFIVKMRYISFHGEDLAIILVEDNTELGEQHEKLERMAHHDYLTDLCNRLFFFELSSPLYAMAKRGDMALGLAMIDIDYFKAVNDTYGHDAGDLILKEVSLIMSQNVRKSDIVARMGGEEFCILLSNCSQDISLRTMERIRKLVQEKTFHYRGKDINVTISVGLTVELSHSLEEMLKEADTNLYKAKNSGRNQVVALFKDKKK